MIGVRRCAAAGVSERVARLSAYGDAIVTELAAKFVVASVEAFLDVVRCRT